VDQSYRLREESYLIHLPNSNKPKCVDSPSLSLARDFLNYVKRSGIPASFESIP
jgi:hypothetical protein